MLFSLLASTLALAATSSAAPFANPYLGDAWAEVTQCSYSAALLVPRFGPDGLITNVNYIGTQVAYYSLAPPLNASVIYSELGEVDTNSRWFDSEKPHTASTNGVDYTYTGTFQPTKENPRPELYLWGPKGAANDADKLHLNAKKPVFSWENKDWRAATCLDKWPVSYVKTLAQKRGIQFSSLDYCTYNAQGKLPASCTEFRSQTMMYGFLPGTL